VGKTEQAKNSDYTCASDYNCAPYGNGNEVNQALLQSAGTDPKEEGVNDSAKAVIH
jgi:hypothetical protein